jgi:hypothetical protein
VTMKRKSASKIRGGWSPNMEQRAGLDEARQVKCLIASEGHEWMTSFSDRLPKPVRRRLADSRFNICAACLTEEAQKIARHPGIATYFAVIEGIERKLDAGGDQGQPLE